MMHTYEFTTVNAIRDDGKTVRVDAYVVRYGENKGKGLEAFLHDYQAMIFVNYLNGGSVPRVGLETFLSGARKNFNWLINSDEAKVVAETR